MVAQIKQRVDLPALKQDVAPAIGASDAYVWYVIALLTLVNVFCYMDRMALAVLLPVIQEELHFSDAEVGLLIGFAFSLVYAVAGIPIARWSDKGVRRDVIALALAAWSVMTALTGAAQNFVQMLAARFGLGATEAGCTPPAQSILCDYVPLERRSGVFAIHSFGLMLGMTLGMMLAGALVDLIGWRWTFVALGTPGVLLALVVRITLREPLRGAVDLTRHAGPAPSFGSTARFLSSSRTYRALIVAVIVNGFVQYGLTQWWPTFYTRHFGLSLSAIGASLGLAIGMGSGLGLLIGGLMANQVAKSDPGRPLQIATMAYALSFPVCLAALFVSSPQLSIILAGVAAICWNVPMGAMVCAIYSVALPAMRATAGAVAVFFSSAFGFGLGPFVVGALSDSLTPIYGVDALRYALVVPALFIPVFIFALLAASRSLPGDLKRIGAL